MAEKILDFLLLREPNIVLVVLGCVLMGLSSGVVGVYSNLRKKSLVGDAVAHAVLPGVCVAFMLTGEKSLGWLTVGAFASGWLALYLIDAIATHTKIKEDTAIALVLSFFFGFGIVLLTFIQHSGNPNQSGLQSFLFGKAASLLRGDVWGFAGLSAGLLVVVLLFYRGFQAVSFDRQFAQVSGLPVRGLEVLLTSLTVLAVVAGIQSVGVVLMSAMLVTPVAAARFWTHDLRRVLVLSGLFGGASGYLGALVSYVVPGMPTGPWIVVWVSVIALYSFLMAPTKGLIARKALQRRHQQRILAENTLKAIYKLGERSGDFTQPHTEAEILALRPLRNLSKGLRRLKAEGYLLKTPKGWVLTNEGLQKGRRVVRLHRLWELYLSQFLNLASDRVHDDAESIEHIITPELEDLLLKRLDFPKKDPHDNTIPY